MFVFSAVTLSILLEMKTSQEKKMTFSTFSNIELIDDSFNVLRQKVVRMSSMSSWTQNAKQNKKNEHIFTPLATVGNKIDQVETRLDQIDHNLTNVNLTLENLNA